MLPLFLLALMAICGPTPLLAAAADPTPADDEDVVAAAGGQSSASDRYSIEGRVYAPELADFERNWQKDTRVSIDDGQFVGLLRSDGTFVISDVPVGSHVVDIVHPEYWYESYRVEINPKGRFRARQLNFVQPSFVVQVPYPLKMKALTRFRYFQTREQWKLADLLLSPMVLMMALPLVLLLVLPRMMNDPETRREMESMGGGLGKMTAGDMPDFSEIISSYLAPKQQQLQGKTSSSSSSAAASAAKTAKNKRN